LTQRSIDVSYDNALVVGNPSPILEDFEPLPYAVTEAKLISTVLNTKPLIGKHASKVNVVQRMKSASLLHFACHGILDCHKDRKLTRYEECLPGAIVLGIGECIGVGVIMSQIYIDSI